MKTICRVVDGKEWSSRLEDKAGVFRIHPKTTGQLGDDASKEKSFLKSISEYIV